MIDNLCIVVDCGVIRRRITGKNPYCGRHCQQFAKYGRVLNDDELKKEFKHGLKKHPLYPSWLMMRDRCNNRNNKAYKNYGGRGIKVCERWDNFANFLQDMGERPKGMTLDRKKNDGDYEPNNCKWATRPQQSANTRLKSINKTGFKWVYRKKGNYKNRPYTIGMRVGSKMISFGFYSTLEEAAYVADQIQLQINGENIPMNFLGNHPIHKT